MKGLLYLLLILQINLAFPQSFDLGEQIRQQVQNSLRETQNLGQIISNNVRQQLLPLNNLHTSISQNINQQMLPLQNLGETIKQNIGDKLQPVYAMVIKNQMKNGVGGTTVVTYGTGKQLIVENGQRYICNGDIQGGECSDLKQPFQILTRQDFCYAPSYAVHDDHICLSTGGLNVEIFNNQFSCHSSNGSPYIILTKQKYQDLCLQASPYKTSYQYYADPNNPSYIPIPNPNPYVTCLNNEINVCNFDDIPSGSGITMTNQNSFSTSFSHFNK